MVKSESGQKLPASFKSGVFDDWRKKVRISVPKVGEAELKGKTVTSLSTGAGGKSYRHKAQIPKTDEQRRIDKNGGRAKVVAGTAGGLKSADQIRKDRGQKEFNKKRSGGGPKGGKGSKSGGARPARK